MFASLREKDFFVHKILFTLGFSSCMLMVLLAGEGMQKDFKRKTFILWNIFKIFCSDTSNCEIESKLSNVG